MLNFASDYIQGACPEILNKLFETNMEELPGYGEDKYSLLAKQKIKKCFNCEDGEVFFITGGTQTNQLIISTMLENYEGVVSAKTGHVSLHEAGAIEYTGHKVIEIPCEDGKITDADLKNYLDTFYSDGNHEHMTFPGLVYISYPTEYGTIYKKKELEAIYKVCRAYDIPLFIDGARLGYGLMSHEADIKPEDLSKLCDVFYIGGTKVGALCGEAVVFTHKNAPKHFVTQIKQHGALLAKGRLNGIQFDVLFTDDLYFRISEHAINMADKLKQIFIDKNYRFFLDSPTNQQFIILENKEYGALSKEVVMSFWEKYDDNHTVVRFATSFATTEDSIDKLNKLLK